MTYRELLKETGRKKIEAIVKLNQALKGDTGWLVKAELERNPGGAAWSFLAREFCETLAQHVDEFIEQANAEGRPWEAYEIGDIYTAYEDDDPELYNLLPVEAQLFTE